MALAKVERPEGLPLWTSAANEEREPDVRYVWRASPTTTTGVTSTDSVKPA